MRFRRLKITGFKSFANPVEFRFDEGLTGIIGPNGCGKSNFVESLRWVMGANSARALRGSEMDDVIFAGSAKRGSRNIAEVSLLIDNSARNAPPQFNDSDILEIVRRITRGAGSEYRVNGRHVRARDVQLIFADASTGANSPALVRQGQISELIAAKPENRRKILEDASNIGGLAGRRREAEQRLKAAEGNLARLADVIGEISGHKNRLSKEAKNAIRYQDLSNDIKTLEIGLKAQNYIQALDTHDQHVTQAQSIEGDIRDLHTQKQNHEKTLADLQTTTQTYQDAHDELVKDHQDKTLQLERQRHEQDRHTQSIQNLQISLQRAYDDKVRLEDDVQDADTTLERLLSKLADNQSSTQHAVDPSWEADRQKATEALGTLKVQLTEAQHKHTQDAAKYLSAEDQLASAKTIKTKLNDDIAVCEKRLKTLADDHTQHTKSIADNAATLDSITKTIKEQTDAIAELEETIREHAEHERHVAADASSAKDRLHSLQSEYTGIQAVLKQTQSLDVDTLLNQLDVDIGYEHAVAVALGDDLNATLDDQHTQNWSGEPRQRLTSKWPDGIVPMSEVVTAPLELSMRLQFIGIVNSELPPIALSPGQRLVNLDGDMRRWDGFVIDKNHKAPTAAHFEYKNKSKALKHQIDAQQDVFEKIHTALTDANNQTKIYNERLFQLRAELKLAETEQTDAQMTLHTARSDMERITTQKTDLKSRLETLRSEYQKADQIYSDAKATIANRPDQNQTAEHIKTLEETIAQTQANLSTLDAKITLTQQQAEQQSQMVNDLQQDITEWETRKARATALLDQLGGDIAVLSTELDTLENQPEVQSADINDLVAEIENVADRMQRSKHKLYEHDQNLRNHQQTLNTAIQTLAEAQAKYSAAKTHVENSQATLNSLESDLKTHNISSADTCAELVTTLPDQPEKTLADLKAKRDRIGPVNLKAESDLKDAESRFDDLMAEQHDLEEAIQKFRTAITTINTEARGRLLKAFEKVDASFRMLFEALFRGGEASLKLVDNDDPLLAGLEIYAKPPGKNTATLSLLSGGEQALTATALIFATFLANPAPVCVLDEVDAPLDDANVDRFCGMLDAVRKQSDTRFVVITHNPVTMSRMDRLFGVTMAEPGISQVVRMDLKTAETVVDEKVAPQLRR